MKEVVEVVWILVAVSRVAIVTFVHLRFVQNCVNFSVKGSVFYSMLHCPFLVNNLSTSAEFLIEVLYSLFVVAKLNHLVRLFLNPRLLMELWEHRGHNLFLNLQERVRIFPLPDDLIQINLLADETIVGVMQVFANFPLVTL